MHGEWTDRTQTFDIENRLASVTVGGQTTQFIYDGDGNLVKKIKPDGSKTLYVLGIFEVDKTSGGTVTRTVTYYPLGGAMRINISGGSNTLYYLLKDHLGSASVVTDASGTTVGEDRFYPYGETRFTTGSMNTDQLFTGQREMTGLGIYHYGARFYSPKLGRFLSADTIVPGYTNPQAWNRYSYVLGNPLKYTDPTGHAQCQTQEDCDDMGTTPMGTGSTGSGSTGTGGSSGDPHADDDIDPNPNCTDCNIYGPIGDYLNGYNGAGGNLTEDAITFVGGDGECVGSVCSFSGGSVPINYAASYDVVLYEGLLIVTIHESYWMPGYAPPLMDTSTSGGSILLSRNGSTQTETFLGDFLPGSVAHRKNLQHRDATIYFKGRENFPDQLVIRVTFGAQGMGYGRFFYQLPYKRP